MEGGWGRVGDWGRLARLSFSSDLVCGVNTCASEKQGRNKGGILAPPITRKATLDLRVSRISRVSLDGLGKKERLLIV